MEWVGDTDSTNFLNHPLHPYHPRHHCHHCPPTRLARLASAATQLGIDAQRPKEERGELTMYIFTPASVFCTHTHACCIFYDNVYFHDCMCALGKSVADTSGNARRYGWRMCTKQTPSPISHFFTRHHFFTQTIYHLKQL